MTQNTIPTINQVPEHNGEWLRQRVNEKIAADETGHLGVSIPPYAKRGFIGSMDESGDVVAYVALGPATRAKLMRADQPFAGFTESQKEAVRESLGIPGLIASKRIPLWAAVGSSHDLNGNSEPRLELGFRAVASGAMFIVSCRAHHLNPQTTFVILRAAIKGITNTQFYTSAENGGYLSGGNQLPYVQAITYEGLIVGEEYKAILELRKDTPVGPTLPYALRIDGMNF